ncbi:MAG TPA: hypothetical protein VLT87_11100 [Thermoanaerobaculia bacterium]|nr:hypothetical protein [Thermoanaerobaculia bacterium]
MKMKQALVVCVLCAGLVVAGAVPAGAVTLESSGWSSWWDQVVAVVVGWVSPEGVTEKATTDAPAKPDDDPVTMWWCGGTIDPNGICRP